MDRIDIETILERIEKKVPFVFRQVKNLEKETIDPDLWYWRMENDNE